MLGDGTPDRQVLAIPALKLNGKAVAGKAKPKYTGLGTIQAHSYYTGFRKIASIMDEEDNILRPLKQPNKHKNRTLMTPTPTHHEP